MSVKLRVCVQGAGESGVSQGTKQLSLKIMYVPSAVKSLSGDPKVSFLLGGSLSPSVGLRYPQPLRLGSLGLWGRTSQYPK